jgi:hypothetical protein
MDTNMQTMQTLWTKDKQGFVSNQKHPLQMAAVRSRTKTTRMWRTIETALKNYGAFAVV